MKFEFYTLQEKFPKAIKKLLQWDKNIWDMHLLLYTKERKYQQNFNILTAKKPSKPCF